jgi:asparagine synthase (glutamine-hydrolysing)
MCGIAGILGKKPFDWKETVQRMGQVLHHRGPDSDGSWTEPEACIGLSHQRLAVIDLSEHGAQPMTSHHGRYVLSYNGEIYNHVELKEILDAREAIHWRGHSDTEVLLAAIEILGLDKTLAHANGMFAFAVWDRESRTLTLARDRMGEKPLYVAWIGNAIAFCSEPAALRFVPEWNGDIDERAVGYLLRYGYIPAPLSIYNGVFKLPAAHTIRLSRNDIGSAPSFDEFLDKCECYWSLHDKVSDGINNPIAADDDAVQTALESLLAESIRLRMVADVPVGTLLSGGIDSTLVTALMQAQSPRPIKSFTIGFEENEFDEAQFSRPIANHLGCDHTEVILSPQDALDIIPRLPDIYNEPFADASQIPTVLISAIARKSVTVGLSGDGGDELFGGYARYRIGTQFWKLLKWTTPTFRNRMGQLLGRPFDKVRSDVAEDWRLLPYFKLWRLGRRLAAASLEDYYNNLLSLSLCSDISSNWPAGIPLLSQNHGIPQGLDTEQQMMYMDQMSYLPDDILVKSDLASMAASLELRIPLLDHHVVEFAWRLPARLRRQGKNGKMPLRRLLYNYVPKELIDRPKMGFNIPLDAWLRGPLKEWMLDLTAPNSLRHGHLNEQSVVTIVKQHISGQANHGYALWPILMFQAWIDRQQSFP